MKIPPYRINLLMYYLIGTIALLWPSIYNGFPLLFADLGTYINSGFKLETPIDRPITYGLLIRLFSFNGTFIWGMLIFQSLIILWTIQLFSRTFFSFVNLLYLMCIIIFLAFISPLSWRVSELLPDILSPVCLMLILILTLRYNAISKREKIACLIIYFVFNSTHLSHFILHLIILTFILITWLVSGKKIVFSLHNWIYLFLITFNLLLISGSAIAKSRAVFQMSALAENGVLYQYLNNECSHYNYKLCNYTNKIQGISGNEFIWSENSPVMLTDGWGKGKAEYHQIITRIFSDPKYLKIFFSNSVQQVRKQFCSFNIGDGNDPYKPGSTPYDALSDYMPSQLAIYEKSLQYDNSLQNIFPFWQKTNTIVFWLSLALLPIVLLITKTMRTLFFPSLILLLTLVINAWTVTTFSCINNRYQSKYTWMITLWLILIATNKWFSLKKINVPHQ